MRRQPDHLAQDERAGRPQTAYICATHRARPGACANLHGAPAEALTDAIQAELKHVFLNPAALGRLLVAEWEQQKQAPNDLLQQQRTVAREIEIINRELDTLLAMVLKDQPPERILDAMRTREREKAVLVARLE